MHLRRTKAVVTIAVFALVACGDGESSSSSSVGVVVDGQCNNVVVRNESSNIGQDSTCVSGDPGDVKSEAEATAMCCPLLEKKEDDDCLRELGFADDLCRPDSV